MTTGLWSVWKGDNHIGYVAGDANALALKRALGEGFVLRRSQQRIPPGNNWHPFWRPVWKGSRLDKPQNVAHWGAFKNGWNLYIVWQLERAGHYAATDETGLSRVARK